MAVPSIEVNIYMVYCIGLTGNIASGKSTVAELFSNLGVDIINADKISRELTLKNATAYDKIVAHFGRTILTNNEELDRRKLRDLIFTDKNEKNWLEHLLHPSIRQEIQQKATQCTSSYCLIEIPLSINKEEYPYLNKILLVTAPLEIQICRVIERDKCTREHALAILSHQPSLEERLKNADDIIINNAGLAELKIEVNRLHHQYLQAALQKNS
jgi:dephospho-CoA kinase